MNPKKTAVVAAVFIAANPQLAANLELARSDDGHVTHDVAAEVQAAKTIAPLAKSSFPAFEPMYTQSTSPINEW